MTRSSRSRLGVYEIAAPLGASYACSRQPYPNTLYLVENLDYWRRPTIWSRLSGRRP